MNESIVTVRYVKALYDLAEENDLLPAIENDIRVLLSVIHESKEFVSFLENPVLKISDKIKILDQLFSKQMNKLTLQFLHLLTENKRDIFLNPICHYFIRYFRQKQGIREASITTASPLSAEYRSEVFKYITKRFKSNIELTEKVDPGIIGGFILRIEDQQINASISAQLNKIKRELIHS
jgi:F-type H+-transporting ATPase subunit delta